MYFYLSSIQEFECKVQYRIRYPSTKSMLQIQFETLNKTVGVFCAPPEHDP